MDPSHREPRETRRSANCMVLAENLFENPVLGGTGHWPVPAGYQPDGGLGGKLPPSTG